MSTHSTAAAPAAPQLLTETQVAAITGLAVSTLRNWRSKRIGPPYRKLGGAVRYDADKLTAWIESASCAGSVQ